MTDLVTAPPETSPAVVEYLHRPLGADPIVGHEAIRLWLRTLFEMLPDWQVEVLVLADRGDVYLARDVDTLRGDKLEREEIFADEASARAAFEAAAPA